GPRTDRACKRVETGGQGGIRTLERLLTVTHFPGVRLKPLGHLSGSPPAGGRRGEISRLGSKSKPGRFSVAGRSGAARRGAYRPADGRAQSRILICVRMFARNARLRCHYPAHHPNRNVVDASSAREL